MIANLPAHEKQAFFGLLDEYFASRPHRLASTSSTNAAPTAPARGVAGLTDRATNAAGAAAGAAASSAVSSALRDQFARTGLVGKGAPPAVPGSRKPAFGAGSRSSSSTQGPTTSPGAAAGAGRSLPPPTRTGAGIPAPVAATQVPAAAPSLPAGAIGSAQVLYDYGDGTDADDLQATEGEHIYLTEKISDDWWRAMSQDQSRSGIIPTTYVRQL